MLSVLTSRYVQKIVASLLLSFLCTAAIQRKHLKRELLLTGVLAVLTLQKAALARAYAVNKSHHTAHAAANTTSS